MVLHKMRRIAKHAIIVVRYGLLTLRYAGLRIALQKLVHQIYSHNVFIGMTWHVDDPLHSSSFQYVVAPASPPDVEEFFQEMSQESKKSRYELLVRKWYHECGFGDCYITRTSDTNEACYIGWIVTSKHIKDMGWENRFPGIKDDEVLVENVYTLEKFRGKGVQRSASRQMYEICKRQGFRSVVGWVDQDNIPQLIAGLKLGFQVFERVLDRHILFRVTRKTIECFDPPVPITIPWDAG